MKSQFEFLLAHSDRKLKDFCWSAKWVQTNIVGSSTGSGVLPSVRGSLHSKCRIVLRYTRECNFVYAHNNITSLVASVFMKLSHDQQS